MWIRTKKMKDKNLLFYFPEKYNFLCNCIQVKSVLYFFQTNQLNRSTFPPIINFNLQIIFYFLNIKSKLVIAWNVHEYYPYGQDTAWSYWVKLSILHLWSWKWLRNHQVLPATDAKRNSTTQPYSETWVHCH